MLTVLYLASQINLASWCLVRIVLRRSSMGGWVGGWGEVAEKKGEPTVRFVLWCSVRACCAADSDALLRVEGGGREGWRGHRCLCAAGTAEARCG